MLSRISVTDKDMHYTYKLHSTNCLMHRNQLAVHSSTETGHPVIELQACGSKDWSLGL